MEDIKTPPHNVEAERAVLGAILLDTTSEHGDRVMDLCLTSGVSEESFFDPRNRAVYAAMLAMNRESKALDYLTLAEELRAKGKLEAIGGAAYLQSIVDQVPTAAHAEHYISIVTRKHLRRTLIDRATKTIEKAYDEGAYPDPRVILGETEKSFLEIGANASRTADWASCINASFEHIIRRFDSYGKSLDGLSTGLRYLDEKIQGLKPAEMIVIAARPSVGKTSLALNIAESAAMGQMLTLGPEGHYESVPSDGGKRHPVAVFSLEMPIEALTQRMVSGRAHVNHWRVARGQVPYSEREIIKNNLAAAVRDLSTAPIYVDDTAGLDVMDLRARARRMKKQHGIELIVIDYLQLCSCREGARQSRQIEVSMISQQIKAMAKELKIPVIVLSQLSRANEQRGDKNEKPKLSDLRDSGAIEQDADVVFLLRRPSRTAGADHADDETLAIIDVAKNRNGETGEVKVNFHREFTRFDDRVPERKDEDELPSEPTYSQGQLGA